jgi:hypothetical protein
MQDWVNAWLKEADLKCMARQSMVVEPPLHSVLSRAFSTIHLTYTYDEKIWFQTQEAG